MMRSLLILLALSLLPACTIQFQPPENGYRSVLTAGTPNENLASRCGTPTLRDITRWSIWADRVSEQKPTLAWLTGDTAIEFTKIYAEIVSDPTALVADTAVVFDYPDAPKVLAMLFYRNCLVASSPLEGDLFNEVMSVIGVDTWKTLVISAPPGIKI